MKISEFDYDLPSQLIAQEPCEPRDAARLLIDRGATTPDDGTMTDLAHLVGPGDLVVVNETRVLPARIHLRKRTGGEVEILLLDERDENRWQVLARPGRRLRAGTELLSGDAVIGFVTGRDPDDGTTFEVEFCVPLDVATRDGEVPLPPYITTPLRDRDRYQTMFAQEAASAAAPTAGLHFTPRLVDAICAVGAEIASVELVVGLDTFRPVTVEDLDDHTMHSERYRVPSDTLDRCREANRVIAVGTTSARALESAALTGSLNGRTDLFIRSGHEWRVVDLLLTNFHLPRSTLLVMIHALVGDRWRHLYEHAIEQDYRMLSFGDAMLLNRHAG